MVTLVVFVSLLLRLLLVVVSEVLDIDADIRLLIDVVTDVSKVSVGLLLRERLTDFVFVIKDVADMVPE